MIWFAAFAGDAWPAAEEFVGGDEVVVERECWGSRVLPGRR